MLPVSNSTRFRADHGASVSKKAPTRTEDWKKLAFLGAGAPVPRAEFSPLATNATARTRGKSSKTFLHKAAAPRTTPAAAKYLELCCCQPRMKRRTPQVNTNAASVSLRI